VALANYTEIVEGRGTANAGVWLDISHLPPAKIAEKLPRMLAQVRAVGVDIAREPMEVAPTAHYSMGGVRVEPATHATGVPGLFAAGEVAAGVHGANRLGGNSLAEILVFGKRAGAAAAEAALGAADRRPDRRAAGAALARLADLDRPGDFAPTDVIALLQRLMWERVGLARDEAGLLHALGALDGLGESARQARAAGPAGLAATLDLRSMLLTAEATVRGALLRTESRGAHQRRDYPLTDAAWGRTIVCKVGPDGMALSTAPLPPPSPAVAAALAEPVVVTHHPLE
jgi:succinate dehydrogenase / fumarate reductase, flavoprotein subunit